MDTFENTGKQPGEQSVQQPPVQANNSTVGNFGANYGPASFTYREAGKKESPYANSPYVMNHQYQQGNQGYQPQQPGNYRRTYYYQPEQPVQKPTSPKKKGLGSFWKAALAAVLTLALVVGSCAITASLVNDRWEEHTEQMEERFNRQIQNLQEQIDDASHKSTGDSVSGSPVAAGDGLTPGQVYARNVDAVVMVYSSVLYYSYGQESAGYSAGSGFIVSEDGYILTNHHVIEGADSILVTTHSGEQYNAQIIGSDSTNDVALLKIEAAGLPYVTLGSSDDLIVGDQVVAIGNPLGELTSTMTVGYVSGKERAVTTDGITIDMIQTDAAINSGNSGGPLFNMKGEVVGITTAKYSGSSSSGASIEGIGFAIPIDDVVEVVNDLIEYGYVKSAYMGVMVREMDPETASIYGLPVGAYVDSVEEGGPADQAGIQAKDIIIGVGDATIEGLNDLTRALRGYEPGDTVTVTVYRGGRELKLSVALVEKPQDITQSGGETEIQPDSEMPSEGSFEEWYEYLFPFFGNGNNGG